MTAHDWQTDAVCAQTYPDLFFSPEPREIEAAINLCGTCPVRKECADLRRQENHRHGVWGGEYYSDSNTPRPRPSEKPIGYTSINLDQAAQLRAQGLTWQKIADQLGCSQSALYKALREQRKTQ